jgi:exonuclease SbcD
MIATGHLFAAGAVTAEGDGVRNLYIGTLAQVQGDVFPPGLDYLALGHLHVPQSVGGTQTIRYSGSPLPMGFGEAGQQKCVLSIDLSSGHPEVAVVPVPVFQRLETLRGDWDAIAAGMEKLKNEGCRAWLEGVYEGDAPAGALRERIEEMTAGSSLEVLRIRNTRLAEQTLGSPEMGESLTDLTPEDVFDRCLSAYDIPESRRGDLRRTFAETLAGMTAEDPRED